MTHTFSKTLLLGLVLSGFIGVSTQALAGSKGQSLKHQYSQNQDRGEHRNRGNRHSNRGRGNRHGYVYSSPHYNEVYVNPHSAVYVSPQPVVYVNPHPPAPVYVSPPHLGLSIQLH